MNQWWDDLFCDGDDPYYVAMATQGPGPDPYDEALAALGAEERA